MTIQKVKPVGAAGNYLVAEDSFGVQGLVAPGAAKLFYTDNVGGGIKEVAIGAADTVLVSQGAGSAPAWAARNKVIASGARALGVAEIADNACAALITVAAAGVLTTDIVDIGYNSTPVGKTGYDPTAATLSIHAFPTADNINILVCNKTGGAVTPAAMTINWKVTR